MVSTDVSKEHAHDDNKKTRAERTALPYTTLLKVLLRSELIMLNLKGRVSIQSFGNPEHFRWNVHSFQNF